MAEDLVPMVRFTVSRENSHDPSLEPKTFSLKLGAEKPLRIGRAGLNDIVVGSRGVSQYHAELRVLRLDGDDTPQLCVRDISMNGTGITKGDGKPPSQIEKGADIPLSDGFVLLVPMLLKVGVESSDRAWLKFELEGTTMEVPDGPESKKASKESRSKAAKVKAAPGMTDEEIEQARLRFVELLLKTKEVTAGTSYEAAKVLLALSPDWHTVDEATRKECFEIFVAHLGSSGQKKKGKKKGKGKEKSKKHKKRQADNDEDNDDAASEEQQAGASPEHKEKKRRERRGGVGADGSPDRKRKREKRGGKRSRSRGGWSASPGGGGGGGARETRRRRHRSSSA